MKVCLVTPDLKGFIKNGGIGTATYALGHILADENNSIDILFTHNHHGDKKYNFNFLKQRLKQKNINLFDLSNSGIPVQIGYVAPVISYLCYNFLKTKDYDLVLFTDMFGVGYYSMWAKKAGLCFHKTELCVAYHGPTEWHLLKNNQTVENNSGLLTTVLEKHSCLLADSIIFATKHAHESAKKLGYIKKNRTYQILYPIEPVLKFEEELATNGISEIVFFGRLEERKGIVQFLERIKVLKKLNELNFIKITLLGSGRTIKNRLSMDFIKNECDIAGLKINIIDNFDGIAAIKYLKSGKKLAIMPSLDETMGYTLIECITNNIPFVCTDIDPFEEVLKYFKVDKKNHTVNFESDQDFSSVINKFLITPSAFVSNVKDLENILKKQKVHWQQVIKNIVKESKPLNKKAAKTHFKKLTIGIVYSGRDKEFTELKNSIKNISSKVKEVLIFDNTKTEEKKLKNNKNLIQELSNVRLLSSKNPIDISTARNKIATNCKTEDILFIDDDNILIEESFVNIYSNLPAKWDVVSAPLLTFAGEESPASKNSSEIRLFVNNEIQINLLNNLAGDANTLIKKQVFKITGGFEKNMSYGEDQLLFLKIKKNRLTYLQCPEPFIRYRLHNNSLSSKADYFQKRYRFYQKVNEVIFKDTEITSFLQLSRYVFEEMDKSISETPYINDYFRNNESPEADIKEKEEIEFAKKLITNQTHEGEQIFLFELQKRNKSLENAAAAASLNVTLDIYSAIPQKITTNLGQEIEVIPGANTVNLKYTQNQSLSLFTGENNNLVGIRNLKYETSEKR